MNAAVEGLVDEAVLRRLVEHVGGQTGTVYGRKGKSYLRQRIGGFNQAARYSPWVVVVDLNAEADCAPALCAEWLPDPAPNLCFRVAIREVEAWLLADGETLARFLGIAEGSVPSDPESLDRPKESMVRLSRRSRKSAIRKDMVPRRDSGRAVGPAYTSRLIEFASTEWRPAVAAKRSNSLKRAIRCLQRLLES